MQQTLEAMRKDGDTERAREVKHSEALGLKDESVSERVVGIHLQSGAQKLNEKTQNLGQYVLRSKGRGVDGSSCRSDSLIENEKKRLGGEMCKAANVSRSDSSLQRRQEQVIRNKNGCINTRAKICKKDFYHNYQHRLLASRTRIGNEDMLAASEIGCKVAPSKTTANNTCNSFLKTKPSTAVFLVAVLLLACNGYIQAASAMDDPSVLDAEFSPTRKPHQQQAPTVASSVPNPAAKVAVAASEPPPTGSSRTNDLEVFLDDMNNNELRAAATGKAMNDPFGPKVLLDEPAEAAAAARRLSDLTTRSNAGNQAQGSHESMVQLEGSHSESQIYSECALILQRTYVKNIADQK